MFHYNQRLLQYKNEGLNFPLIMHWWGKQLINIHNKSEFSTYRVGKILRAKSAIKMFLQFILEAIFNIVYQIIHYFYMYMYIDPFA